MLAINAVEITSSLIALCSFGWCSFFSSTFLFAVHIYIQFCPLLGNLILPSFEYCLFLFYEAKNQRSTFELNFELFNLISILFYVQNFFVVLNLTNFREHCHRINDKVILIRHFFPNDHQITKHIARTKLR